MRTYQFTIPHAQCPTDRPDHVIKFVESIAREFGGATVTTGLGLWTAPGALDVVENEEVLVVQVTTSEGGLLKDRLCAYLRNQGESAAYLGIVGEHDIIPLDKPECRAFTERLNK